MRAGLAASGPRAGFEAVLHLQGYGFVLQPTGAANTVQSSALVSILMRAATFWGSAHACVLAA